MATPLELPCNWKILINVSCTGNGLFSDVLERYLHIGFHCFFKYCVCIAVYISPLQSAYSGRAAEVYSYVFVPIYLLVSF